MPDDDLQYIPPDDDQMLRTYLDSRDVACPLCGYNLRSLQGRFCPECGQELQLRVGLAHQRIAAYLASVIAAGVGFGGSLLFSAVALVYAPPDWWEELAGMLLILQLVVCLAALIVFLVAGRAIRRWTMPVQVVIAAISWTVVLGFSLGVIVSFND